MASLCLHFLLDICYSYRLVNSRTLFRPILSVIVSITKFSILIGSARAYLSRNWRAITQVSNYRYPIITSCNWTPVIGHLRHSHANHVQINGFFLVVFLLGSFLLFIKAIEHIFDFFHTKEVPKEYLTSNFVIDTIN